MYGAVCIKHNRTDRHIIFPVDFQADWRNIKLAVIQYFRKATLQFWCQAFVDCSRLSSEVCSVFADGYHSIKIFRVSPVFVVRQFIQHDSCHQHAGCDTQCQSQNIDKGVQSPFQ